MIYACTAPARSVARTPRRAMRRAALDRADFARLSPRARHAALLDAHDRYARGDGDALAREHRFVRDDEEDERQFYILIFLSISCCGFDIRFFFIYSLFGVLCWGHFPLMF